MAMQGSRPMVTGMFRDRESAERAYGALSSRGYSDRDVNLAMSDETRKRYFTEDVAVTELGNKAAKGAGVGGTIGATAGAIAAAIAPAVAPMVPPTPAPFAALLPSSVTATSSVK